MVEGQEKSEGVPGDGGPRLWGGTAMGQAVLSGVSQSFEKGAFKGLKLLEHLTCLNVLEGNADIWQKIEVLDY